jgi:hypothetical protein
MTTQRVNQIPSTPGTSNVSTVPNPTYSAIQASLQSFLNTQNNFNGIEALRQFRMPQIPVNTDPQLIEMFLKQINGAN